MRKPCLEFLLVLLAFASPGFAQNAPATPQPQSSPAPQHPSTSPTTQTEPQAKPQPTPNPNRLEIEPVKEHKITPEEGKELFRSVDEILHFASKDTGLPIKKKVKRTIVSRQHIEKYLGEKF